MIVNTNTAEDLGPDDVPSLRTASRQITIYCDEQTMPRGCTLAR
jgi:hypothetical protein